MKLRCAVAAILALASAPALSAQMTPICESIDSYVLTAQTVVIARVNHVGEAIPDRARVPHSSVVFDIKQTIKGPIQKQLVLDAHTIYRDRGTGSGALGSDDLKIWQQSRARLMIFVSGSLEVIIPLDGTQADGIDGDFSVLRNADEFIRAAIDEVRRSSGATNHNVTGFSSPAVIGTSFEHCYIYVPIDDRMLKTEQSRKELADLAQNDPDPDKRAAAKLVLDHWQAKPISMITAAPMEEIFNTNDDAVPRPVEIPDPVWEALGTWLDGDFPASRRDFSAEKLHPPGAHLELYLLMGIENNREYHNGYTTWFWLIEENTQANKAKILWWPNHTLVAIRTSYRGNNPYPDIETNFGVPESMFKATYRYRNGQYFAAENNYTVDQSAGSPTIPHVATQDAKVTPAPFKMNIEASKLPPEPTQFEPDFPHPGPIADANPAIRHHVTLMVPTRFKIARDAKTLSVGLDPASMRPVAISVGKKMMIGEREDDRIYEVGQPRPVKSGGIGLSGLTEDNNEASIDTGATRFYNFSQGHIPAPGKTYIVEMKFTVFETKTPPQHMWRPEMDKILWTGTLKTTVGQ